LKLLVTGGGGLLGSAICDQASADFMLLAPRRTELNLEDVHQVTEYIKLHKPDVCIHSAAHVFGLGGHKLHPNKALLVNSRIDINLISAFQINPPKKFIYVGTVASYGYPYLSNRLKEQDFFKGIPHIGEYGYAMAKRFGYDLANSLKEFDTVVSYAIMTNLFGPNDNFNSKTGHVIPSLVSRAVSAQNEKAPLEVWGRPTDTRDFLHSSIAAKRILQLALSGYEGLINIGSGEERSISSVANLICSRLGIESISSNTSSINAISHRVLDIDLLNNNFGIIPDSFESDLENTIEWYLKNKEIARN
jgi:GDP-L-fucose synthase